MPAFDKSWHDTEQLGAKVNVMPTGEEEPQLGRYLGDESCWAL